MLETHAMTRKSRTLALLLALAAPLAACGGDAGGGNETDDGDTTSATTGAGSPAGATTGPGGSTAELNGCADADYVDQTAEATIAFAGVTFTPRCTLVNAGQAVAFQGSFSAHPLKPGNAEDPAAGSAGNPIVETRSGESASFAFPTPGDYAFYCESHSFGAGEGMAGVIRVK